MNYELRIKKPKNTGYTIIETMIAVAVFLVVVMVGVGSLLNANLLHQKSQDMRSIMDNLSFVMEDISRNLRTGYNYRCVADSNDLLSGSIGTAQSGANCRGIAFEESTEGDPLDNNDQWVYLVDNNKILRLTEGPDYISVSGYTQLTPNEVFIESISGFSVLGAEPISSNSQQPFVTIRLIGNIIISSKDIITPFSLQTSVSQRLVDI